MRKVLANRRYSAEFDSLMELGDFITTAPKTWTTANGSRDYTPEESWDLFAGYDGAVRMAREGWLEGAQRAQEALKVFVPRDPSPAMRTDFYGYMPHVPRYCAGAPDNMVRHHPMPTIGNGRVLTLYVPVCANAGTKAECMANFGLGVAQYVNQLEQQGIRVELYGCASSQFVDMHVTHTWKIKSADQPLDLAVLCFSIGHPAMLRRLEFALCERCPAKQNHSYGQAADTKLSDLIDPPTGAYVLNGMLQANSIAKTPASALEYITKQINRAFDIPDAYSTEG